MMDIEKNIPLPGPPKRKVAQNRLTPTAKLIFEGLTACEDGDSFLVSGEYQRVAMTGGRIAKRVGCAIKTAQETPDHTRVWRISLKKV